MSDRKYSTLNPLASSFVPGGKMTEKLSMREIAERYVNEFLEKKEAKGEKSLTKLEMANIVGQLISLRFKAISSSDYMKINNYISDKILRKNIPAFKPPLNSDTKQISYIKSKFDLSKFQPPKPTYLLVAFWGLYRHEQAVHPLLSLSIRPEAVTDKIWSFESSDKRLWNQSCVGNVCACPPIFGYTVPATFFGNPSYLHSTCQEQRIHLNHYSESSEGNEFILTSNWNLNLLEDQPFVEDTGDLVNAKLGVEEMKYYFKTMMTGICDLLAKYTETPDIPDESDASDDSDYFESFWDADYDLENSRIPFEEQKHSDLVDNDEHPLLEVQDFEEDEGVSMEIEEMIRRSLSPKRNLQSQTMSISFEDVDLIEEELICDPPCSIWCDAANKKDIEKVTEIDLTPKLDAQAENVQRINLVSPEELNSPPETMDKSPIIDLKPGLNLPGRRVQKLGFRRSFSVNDCDPYYYEAKFGFHEAMAQATHSMSSRDMLAFLRKDPINFFKTFDRSNSWKDTDSGFMSHWSSQEELLDYYKDQEDRCSMWGLFNGEDSLWKPLPECVTKVTTNEKPLPHRRVRDLKRQRSLN